MSRNSHCRILGDVSRSFLSSALDDETAESAKVNILSADHRAADLLHHLLYDG